VMQQITLANRSTIVPFWAVTLRCREAWRMPVCRLGRFACAVRLRGAGSRRHGA
jgi:hypothetical protein